MVSPQLAVDWFIDALMVYLSTVISLDAVVDTHLYVSAWENVIVALPAPTAFSLLFSMAMTLLLLDSTFTCTSLLLAV